MHLAYSRARLSRSQTCDLGMPGLAVGTTKFQCFYHVYNTFFLLSRIGRFYVSTSVIWLRIIFALITFMIFLFCVCT